MSDASEIRLNILNGRTALFWRSNIDEMIESIKDIDQTPQVMALIDQIVPELREVLTSLDLDDPATVYDVILLAMMSHALTVHAPVIASAFITAISVKYSDLQHD